MDVLGNYSELWLRLWHKHDLLLANADKRVADWPLMTSYWPTVGLTLLYLLTIYAGTKLMSARQPFEFKWLLIAYNLIVVVLNGYIFHELLTASWKLNYSYSCQPVHYGDDPDELRIAKALWWYFISKLVELVDTVFIILRKKTNQISFLHVYHHVTMFPNVWICVKWYPGGQAFFVAMMNSFVHVIMYTYYALAAFGPLFQKYLWWKRYLTILQLLQFTTGIVYIAQSVYVECPFPVWIQLSLILYGITIIVLFINFYIKSYLRHGTTAAKKKVLQLPELGCFPSVLKDDDTSNSNKLKLY